MDTPNVPAVLMQAAQQGVEYKPLDTTFFLGRETLVFADNQEMAGWRKRLFGFLSRNAESATRHYYIPVNRVVELGAQVEL
jgi:KUP system potassium uptake protein